MTTYLLGLASLPALYGAFWLLCWASAPPVWVSHYCQVCPWRQEREDHPLRPWWVWRLVEGYQHRWFETRAHKGEREASRARWSKRLAEQRAAIERMTE